MLSSFDNCLTDPVGLRHVRGRLVVSNATSRDSNLELSGVVGIYKLDGLHLLGREKLLEASYRLVCGLIIYRPGESEVRCLVLLDQRMFVSVRGVITLVNDDRMISIH